MNQYGPLAQCYDAMTTDVNYPQWVDYIEAHIAKSGKKVRSILDLACGTGSLSWILAERKYEVIGVDISPEMLSQAMSKSNSYIEVPPMFLCQSMDELELYGGVDACVCMLDSINHVIDETTLIRAFEKVYYYLEYDGIFIFDVLTQSHFQKMDAGMFIDETDEAYCVWRTEYDSAQNICTYVMDVFLQEGSHWIREQEVHQEYAYTTEKIGQYLEKAGFCDITLYGNLEMRPPKQGEERVFFTARKKGE